MAKHIKDKHQKEAAAEQESRTECWANFTSPQATGKGQTAAGEKRRRRYDRQQTEKEKQPQTELLDCAHPKLGFKKR
jgi:hypothetical protein